MTDAINPMHYKSHPSGVECIDVIFPLLYAEGNAIKYLWRAGMKDDDIQELNKAKWYLNDLLARGISSKHSTLPTDSTNAFLDWYDAEPRGYRRSAVTLIFNGYFKEAILEVDKWLDSIYSQS